MPGRAVPHALKRELLDLRRALWPQREATNAMLRDETPVLTAEARTFLRDCADHSFQLLDFVEEWISAISRGSGDRITCAGSQGASAPRPGFAPSPRRPLQ